MKNCIFAQGSDFCHVGNPNVISKCPYLKEDRYKCRDYWKEEEIE